MAFKQAVYSLALWCKGIILVNSFNAEYNCFKNHIKN